MEENPCTCTWKCVWHHIGPADSGSEVSDYTITEYSLDCPHHHDIAHALKLARKALQQK